MTSLTGGGSEACDPARVEIDGDDVGHGSGLALSAAAALRSQQATRKLGPAMQPIRSDIAVAEQQIEAIRSWARSKSRVEQVRLFGSRRKGTHRPDSDLDIAVTVSERRSYTRSTIWFFDAKDWGTALSARIGIRPISESPTLESPAKSTILRGGRRHLDLRRGRRPAPVIADVTSSLTADHLPLQLSAAGQAVHEHGSVSTAHYSTVRFKLA
ncbi:nucleotidyltransferase domain-containing protein [Chelatococcus reniformis]|uniref:nucleotidyltransferase domain-containing protein n=1 Tax=Chelatococcus reniformis TaxID=1494448 RepID=UPI00166BAF95|nr:nucleotidyltransferase domain-containing protein [Chelatococcus reniformis]